MRTLITLIFLSFTYFSNAQTDSLRCENLKVGKFYVLSGSDTCFIERTENRQYEQCNGNEERYELIVIWLKDNKYILRDMHYNPTNAAKVMRKDIVMTILETHSDYHIVHVRSKGQHSYQMTVYCLNR